MCERVAGEALTCDGELAVRSQFGVGCSELHLPVLADRGFQWRRKLLAEPPIVTQARVGTHHRQNNSVPVFERRGNYRCCGGDQQWRHRYDDDRPKAVDEGRSDKSRSVTEGVCIRVMLYIGISLYFHVSRDTNRDPGIVCL